MSIYIKGIGMPTKDEELRLIIRSNGQVIISHETYYEETEAIPVSPHGDLIERKALCLTDFEIVMCDGDYKNGMKMLLEKIESAPIVISAEEDNI